MCVIQVLPSDKISESYGTRIDIDKQQNESRKFVIYCL